MAARYRFISVQPMFETPLHSNLKLVDPKWNWALGGNGQLTAKITIPDNANQRDQIKVATKPWQSAIYVNKTSDNSYPWGGPVIKRVWNRRSGQIAITCVEWRAWLYMLIMEPWNTGGLDRWFEYLNQDQLSIARQMVQYAVDYNYVAGCPSFTYDAIQTSGKNRDLTFWGSQMQRVGNLIDSMANRDGGFEWSIGARPLGVAGAPRLHFYTYYPYRGSIIPGLHFKSTPVGSNCEPGDIEEDASQRYNRVWVTGAGQPPDMVFGWDIDPEQPTGSTLRLDGSWAYSSVIERPTLMSHARRIRKFYSAGTETLPITHNFQQIDPDSYQVGDRGRLQIKDRFTDLDLDAARVISKEVDMSGAGSVKAVLDLTDFTLPETDSGGAI